MCGEGVIYGSIFIVGIVQFYFSNSLKDLSDDVFNLAIAFVTKSLLLWCR